MSFSFDFGKFKKRNPKDYSDLLDDEFDYEFADEFFDDESGDFDEEDDYDL